MNIKTKIRVALSLMTGVAFVALAAGCNHESSAPGSGFHSDEQAWDINQIEDAQTARAARQDATLRDYHFSADQLNSLGQERLDLMLHDGGVYTPLVIYLDVPSDDQIAGRRQSVAMFLKDRGVRDDQIKLEMGANPKSISSVEPLALPGDEQSKNGTTPATPAGPANGTSGQQGMSQPGGMGH